jgi:hypothetical protein
MTHRQLRRIAALGTVAAMALALSGCAYNPFQPSPGGVSFKMTQDGMVSYENNGRDIDSAQGSVTFPNGARGNFRVVGSKGGDVSAGAVQQQALINMALMAMLPKLSAADLMKLIAAQPTVPAVPVP